MWTRSVCVRAWLLAPGLSDRKDIVAQPRAVCRQYTSHEHGDDVDGKKSVYAVQLSALPCVLHTYTPLNTSSKTVQNVKGR